MHDSPSVSEYSESLQVQQSEACTTSSRASSYSEVIVGDPVKANIPVSFSCNSSSSLSASDNPNSSSNNKLITQLDAKPYCFWAGKLKIDGILHHGFFSYCVAVR